MPADIIRLNRMVFHAYHGYWDEERQVGQRFEVDVELQINVQQAASSDNIRDTIDLYKVYQTVARVVTTNSFKLVETLTQVIADTLLREFNPAQVRVRVRKPNSPVPGISDGIEVEIQRSAAMAG
ncbi:MAG: dihydroneopterin aldolase [candidate division KSB1 bacterium]|nr:dihydroneopterin aldolase [candidate division KSB1 bacterium]MDZ7276037.1 dihydroneopterin aldolase [candidate division KSB1 bacterium]MDZ7285681.1 dihydroneopterin aldolase [candidate division KSB1 bacterium]MDZ7298713.1 dihydroneopterin aldolase [candidate division KSB1 bacterium]MDZ7307538.1 dihydroneopterin aldolase [candidate division KSB1 bacterium]